MKVFNMNSMVKKYLTCEQHVKSYFNLHYTRTAWLKVSYIVQHGKNFVQQINVNSMLTFTLSTNSMVKNLYKK